MHLAARIAAGLGGYPEPVVAALLAEVICGLEHIHAHGIVHRDIKVAASFGAFST